MAIIKGARNLDAAKKFVDWALTVDAQKIGLDVKEYAIPTNRNVPLPPMVPNLTEVKVIHYDFAKYGSSETRKRLLERWEKDINASANDARDDRAIRAARAALLARRRRRRLRARPVVRAAGQRCWSLGWIRAVRDEGRTRPRCCRRRCTARGWLGRSASLLAVGARAALTRWRARRARDA